MRPSDFGRQHPRSETACLRAETQPSRSSRIGSRAKRRHSTSRSCEEAPRIGSTQRPSSSLRRHSNSGFGTARAASRETMRLWMDSSRAAWPDSKSANRRSHFASWSSNQRLISSFDHGISSRMSLMFGSMAPRACRRLVKWWCHGSEARFRSESNTNCKGNYVVGKGKRRTGRTILQYGKCLGIKM